MNVNKLLLAAFVITSTSVGADSMKKISVKSKEHTCSDLQQLVKKESHVVLSGFLNSKARVYPTSASCKNVHDLIATTPAWKTSDNRYCVVGYVCQPIWYHHRS